MLLRLENRSVINDSEWANSFNWEDLGKIWKAGGQAMAPVSICPITAMFGKIGSMTNCNVSISFGVPAADKVVM